MMKGYMGKILSINLSNSEISSFEFEEQFARAFLGGNGFAVKLIHDLVSHDTDPLSEGNAVVLATGPVNGTPVWGSGRGHLASLSPLTGTFFDSNYGGNFAAMMKRTGYDAIVLTGKAPTPVYILIDDETVALKSARELWGRTTEETHQLLREREGKETESAVIGPAGENGVLFANLVCSGKRISAAGRGGIGAVFGSKNCKGIAVRGTKSVVVENREKLVEYLKTLFPDLKEKAKVLTTLGTPFLVTVINDKGKLCTRNAQRETFEHAALIGGELIAERYIQKNVACFGCPVACGKLVAVPSGEFANRQVKIPEYETLYSMGSMLENADIVSILNGNALCDTLGMDTISLGVSIAFLAECVERGIVSEGDIDMTVSFGSGERLSSIIRAVAFREGTAGNLIAEGSERMAARFGGEAHKYLYTAKGLEIAGHSARGLRQMSLGYATATRGGSHHDTRPAYYATDPEIDPGFDHQPEYCVNSEHNTAVGDSLVLCRFLHERAFGMQLNESLVSLLRYITGWDIDLEELKGIGERIYNLERVINVNRGIDRARDTLPYRVMHEPIPDGPSQGWYCPPDELDAMLDRYYSIRGWDERGIPTPKKLSELGLK